MPKPTREPYTPFRGTFTIVNDAYLALEKKHPHLARAAGAEYTALLTKEKTQLRGHPQPRTIAAIKKEMSDLENDISDLQSEIRELEAELDDLKGELAAIKGEAPEGLPEEAQLLFELVKQYENIELEALKPKPQQEAPQEAQLLVA